MTKIIFKTAAHITQSDYVQHLRRLQEVLNKAIPRAMIVLIESREPSGERKAVEVWGYNLATITRFFDDNTDMYIENGDLKVRTANFRGCHYTYTFRMSNARYVMGKDVSEMIKYDGGISAWDWGVINSNTDKIGSLIEEYIRMSGYVPKFR